MAEIFVNPYKNTTLITASGCVVKYTIGDGGEPKNMPIVMTGITINYGRSVSPVVPLNSSGDGKATKYYIAGTPSGSFSTTGMFAERGADVVAFLQAVGQGDLKNCKPINLILAPFSGASCTLQGEGGSTTKLLDTIHLYGVMLNSVGFSLAGGDGAYLTMPLSFQFNRMELKS